MHAHVQIPTPLRQFTGGASSVTVDDCGTVDAALTQLSTRYPDVRRHLFSDGGELRHFVNVYVNEDNIRDMSGPSTAVADGDTLIIVPSIAGGAPLPRWSQPCQRKAQLPDPISGSAFMAAPPGPT